MASKLTTLEKRAHAECARMASEGGGQVVVRWMPSRMWSRCPRIDDRRGAKCAQVSGCGYDKLSAALVDFLIWLPSFKPVPFCPACGAYVKKGWCGCDGSRPPILGDTGRLEDLWSAHGAGVNSVIHRLARHGWRLEQTVDTKELDVFQLSRMEPVDDEKRKGS